MCLCVCLCVCRVVPAGGRTSAAERRSAAGNPGALCCAQRRQFQPGGHRLRQRGSFTANTVTSCYVHYVCISSHRSRDGFDNLKKDGGDDISKSITVTQSVKSVTRTVAKYRSQVKFHVFMPFVNLFSLQGEYIASAKALQLEVFFFKKQKEYR